jgi:simple sugar transport system ATP-binding protein
VTVFRDARHIVTAPVADLPRADLVAAMTGDTVAARHREAGRAVEAGGVAALTVRDLTDGDGAYRQVSFEIAEGEIVGLAGAAGSGRTEVAETVVGLRPAAGGQVEIAGHRPRPGSVPDALSAGAGFVPQDRHRQGLVPDMSIADNGTLTVPARLGPHGFISTRRRNAIAADLIEKLAIKTPSPRLAVSGLSGGNQQKVVMARALADEPRLLVLINPTSGVDVRSKEFLLDKVEEAARSGAGVLIASDELDDLRVCDRVLVMFRARATTEFARGWHDHELVAAMEGVDLDA